MTTLERDFRTHCGAAQDCKEDRTRIELALEQSKQLDELSVLAERAFKNCVDSYCEFRMWRAEIDLAWSEDPETYNPELHRKLRSTYSTFESVLRDLRGLLAPLHALGISPSKADQLRDLCASMAGVAAMDNMEMPQHMVDLTESAIEAYESGADVGTSEEE